MEPGHSEQQPTNVEEHTQADHKPLVLLIDDSRIVRVSIKRVLSSEFELLEAVDGEDGWEKLEANDNIQVVITDAGMPRLDGFELIERIRAHDTARINDIPIMMVTGAEEQQTDVKDRALDLGATDFITKPFDNAQLIARTRALASLHKTKRNLDETSVELEEQSTIDKLTQISNKKYMLQRGAQDFAFALRHQKDMSVIAIKIDDHQGINQKYGQETAEQVLVWIASILKKSMRKEDTVARIADETFAIIAPAAGRMAAATLSERIRKFFELTPFTETVISLPITVSLGMVSLGKDKLENFEAVADAAEERANYAEESGGNRVIANARPDTDKSVHTQIEEQQLDHVPELREAVQLILENKSDLLIPHMEKLATEVLPLIELFNSHYNWECEQHIAKLKERISN